MLCEFIRNKNREPIGCVVAVDRDCIGVSLLNPKDKFNREVARNLAAGRALSGVLPDVRGRKEEVVEKAIKRMARRAYRYFQDEYEAAY